MQMIRRNLFESELLQVVHVRARAASAAPGEVERQSANVVVLPLAGVFAKHDGPRRQVTATPSHAVLIAREIPYRVSLPGAVGDECLTLRFSPDALARVAPDSMLRDGFDPTLFAPLALLPPQLMLARSVLWRHLAAGAWDPLGVEELGVGLLVSTLRLARNEHAAGAHEVARRASAAQRRRIARAIEAISLEPARRWTLGSLSEITGSSPWHFAHGFRATTGLSPYQFVLRARLSSTLPALLETDAELARIALDAGFASHSHFSARFRAAFGWAPRELRRHANGRVARELRKIMTARNEVGV